MLKFPDYNPCFLEKSGKSFSTEIDRYVFVTDQETIVHGFMIDYKQSLKIKFH
jgi:hypothetical protein